MANVIFATQRGDSEEALFISQFGEAEVSVNASLSASSNVVASLQFGSKFIFASLSSSSILLSDLQKHVALSSAVSAATAVVATLQDHVLVSSNAVGNSAILADLQLIDSRMRASLYALSTVQSSVTTVVIPKIAIAANLVAGSSVSAVLFVTAGSVIPKNVRLRAVPIDSDSLQIVRYRGDTYADQFLVFDDKTGGMVDISGFTFRLTLSTAKNPSSLSQNIYTLFGVVDDPSSSVVSFSPTDVQADRVGFFYYDLEVRDSVGKVKTLVSSSYVYLQDITK